MEEKITKQPQKSSRFAHWAELITWAVMILVLVSINLLPQKIIATDVTYYLIGAIVGFALLYYLVICRIFTRTQSLWIKDISDVIIISVLIIVAKDYGIYFFSLYFLPIAAAALVLGTIDSLLIAALACIFVVFEIYLNAQGILPQSQEVFIGIWQIGFIVLITLFCRFLALQIRQEKKSREQAEARSKALEIIEKREREFMILTSHQLYTPLSIIRGFSSLMYYDERKKLTKKQLEFTKEIYDNSKRMINLISELLSISRIRSDQTKFKRSNTDINLLISHVIEQLQPKIDKKKIKIIYERKALPNIYCDPLRLEQAIFNLVDNAIKFCDKGTITINCKATQKEIIVSVSDTGRGIADQDLQKLFQPFYRGKNILELEKEGTGLGLYIAKNIIEKHGGDIWVTSKVDEGSTFSFSLPIIESRSKK